ncbi:MAG TPA: hypothetical protein VEE86_02230 [Thermoplasmata archaeon]|nr:hypothetical protein [Thermoplasmata archaeon]
MADEPPWTTPSALGEYAFCPRAHFYRLRADPPPSRASVAGETYHARRLSSERWRDEHRAIPWLAVAVGVGLVAIAVVVTVL